MVSIKRLMDRLMQGKVLLHSLCRYMAIYSQPYLDILPLALENCLLQSPFTRSLLAWWVTLARYSFCDTGNFNTLFFVLWLLSVNYFNQLHGISIATQFFVALCYKLQGNRISQSLHDIQAILFVSSISCVCFQHRRLWSAWQRQLSCFASS